MIHFKMNDGHEIPALGFGVYLMTSAEVEEFLPKAIEAGYRHIDTANAYFNEVAVGKVIRESGIPREDFFVTTKLFPQSYPYEQCKADIDATLERLGLDYVDLLLFHQPYGDYVDGWRAMEEAVRAGKVRSIGLSNFPVRKIEQIMESGPRSLCMTLKDKMVVNMFFSSSKVMDGFVQETRRYGSPTRSDEVFAFR